MVRAVEMFYLTSDPGESHLELLLIKLQMISKPGGSQNVSDKSSINMLPHRWQLLLKNHEPNVLLFKIMPLKFCKVL